MAESASLTTAKKKRTQAKQYLTKAEKELKSCYDLIVNGQEVCSSRIQHLVENFESKLKTFDNRQGEYELLLDEDEMLHEIETIAEFRDSKVSDFIEIKDVLLKKVAVKDEYRLTTSSAEGVKVNLPKLELPFFYGDVCQWQSFWDRFSAIIDKRTDLSNVNKFSYLQSLLKNEAKSCLQGLSLTENNYETAKEILQKRFGRKEKVIVSHIQKLLYISSKGHQELWKLYDEVQIHVRSLENLDIKGDNYGLVLTPLILHQLPNEIRLEWARQSEGKEGDLDYLLSFLYSEIQRRERSQTFGKTNSIESVSFSNAFSFRKENRSKGSASALLNAETKKPVCAFCCGEHFSDKCPDILSLSHGERKEKIRSLDLCFRCLSKTHKANNCQRRCYHCKGSHHSVLHYMNKNNSGASYHSTKSDVNTNNTVSSFSTADVTNVLYNANEMTGHNTLMQCVQVPIKGQDVCILFDSGSDRSYIKSETAKRLKLVPTANELICLNTFAASKSEKNCPIFDLFVNDMNLQLLGIDKICEPLLRAKLPHEVMKKFENIPIYEQLDKDNLIKVDILIGLDLYWSVIEGNAVKVSEGLVAQKTKLGWMISGYYSQSNKGSKMNKSVSLFCSHGPSETTVRQAWELDAIGINNVDSTELVTSPVFNDFSQRVSLSGTRYQVGLPWKSNEHKHMLVNNVDMAKKRLANLDKRLGSNPELKERYDKVFDEMESQDMIEEVPLDDKDDKENPVYYLPHRPVVREESQSTKVRPVFDASAKGQNGVSLNDCMEVGPNLIPDLTGILLRFRRWRFGLTADIQKAFLQIELRESDRDVHRFLLRSSGDKIRHMRFKRVTFGNASSPFMLNATLKLHLAKQEENRTIAELMDNLYVDDWLTGCDDESSLTKLREEAVCVMKKGSFHLTKWASNSPEIRNSVEKSLHGSSNDTNSQKVLGVGWDPQTDSFHFKHLSSSCGVLHSKRTLLGMIARTFDPLGFINPFTVTLKIMFQEAWKEGYDWDSVLPEEMQNELDCWISSLHRISLWNIPRRLSSNDWSRLDNVELVAFADASEKAYGCCIYLKSVFDGEVDMRLVISKVRVAPLKRVTLPRLELLAALLAARLFVFVRNALHLPDTTPYTCYSDSMITLGWIKGEPFKWKQFVRNRVTEIQQMTDPSKWRHCPGKHNPADLLTRGVSASVLTSSQSMWLNGPDWALVHPIPSFIDQADDKSPLGRFSDLNFEREENDPICSLVSVSADDTFIIDFDRFSSFSKLLRVVSIVLRFTKRIRKIDVGSEFDCLNEAKATVFRLLQRKYYSCDIEELKSSKVLKKGSSLFNLCPFIGEDGLLRVKGRLGHAQTLSFDEKHPIILPKCHASLLLVKSQHLTLKHAGVNLLITSLRDKYWIVSLRPLAKKVVRFCIDCQKQDSRLLDQCMAPLPEARLTQSPPFSVVGIDYAGPLFCCDDPGKKYILLFTCAVTRAVHLELMDSMTTEEFLLAFRRFISRRAMPAIVYSDNAQTFKKAQSVLREYLGMHMFQWKKQPALSPWWGGFYERMVRCVKSSLRKTIGNKSIPKSELEATLIEIEACINSRPLTYISENDTYLTPSHFLIGRGCPLTPPELTNINLIFDLSTLYEDHTLLLDHLWYTWKTEYLRSLPPLRNKLVNKGLKIGSIVLIQDENKKRLLWDLGKVVKLYKGLDGCVRAAQVKTKNNCLVRSVQRLLLLELEHSENLGYESDDSLQPDVDKDPELLDSISNDKDKNDTDKSVVKDKALPSNPIDHDEKFPVQDVQ